MLTEKTEMYFTDIVLLDPVHHLLGHINLLKSYISTHGFHIITFFNYRSLIIYLCYVNVVCKKIILNLEYKYLVGSERKTI